MSLLRKLLQLKPSVPLYKKVIYALVGLMTFWFVSETIKQRKQSVPNRHLAASLEKRNTNLVATQPTIGHSPNSYFVARSDEPQLVKDLAVWIPNEPATPLGKWLVRLWASPITFVGFLIGLTTGGKPVIQDGVFKFTNGFGPFGKLYVSAGTSAITFGHTVICKFEPSETLWRHELAHTRQAERLSLLFGLIYTWANAVYGYGRNPLERAARRAALQMPTDSKLFGAASRLDTLG